MKSSIIGVIIAVVVIIIIIAVVAATYHPSSVKATLTNIIYTVYVANRGSNTVSVINTATNTVTATVTVGSGSSGVAIGS